MPHSIARSGGSEQPSSVPRRKGRVSVLCRDHPILAAIGVVPFVATGVVLLLASMFRLHPALAVIVLVGYGSLVMLSLVRLCGLVRGSMRLGEIDRFIVGTWLSLAKSVLSTVSMGSMVIAWFVVAAALGGVVTMFIHPQVIEWSADGTIVVLEPEALEPNTAAAVEGFVLLVLLFGTATVGSLLTWRWLRRRFRAP